MNGLKNQTTLADLAAYCKRVLTAPAIRPAGPITEIRWHGDTFTAHDAEGNTAMIASREVYEILKQAQFLS